MDTDFGARWRAAIPRVVLGVLAGLAGFAWLASDQLNQGTELRFAFTMSSTTSGVVQLFFDKGAGFSEADSVTAPVAISPGPLPYALPLSVGRYRGLRLDPNNGPGEFRLSDIRIEDQLGRIVTAFRADGLTPMQHLTVVAKSADAVTLRTGPDQGDPQLLGMFVEGLDLTPRFQHPLWLAAMLIGCVAAGLLVMSGLDAALRRRRPAPARRAGWAASPARVVTLAALAATLAATYPLFLGRSLVSPANGAVVMLYDRAPFTPGARDFVIEDHRGTDTGAMMWGIMPYSRVQREALAAGEWPLWDRYNNRPLWGQGLSFFLDPMHLASLAIPDPALAWDLRFVAGRALFAAGLGLAALAITGSTAAAALVAIAAPFFGIFTFRLNHPAAFAVAYVPWLIGALVMLARQRERRGLAAWAAAAAAATALHLVASTPKEGAIAVLAAYGVGALTAILAPGLLRERGSRLLGVAAAGVVGLLIAAPHWLVFLDTLSRSWTFYDVTYSRFGSWPNISALVLGAAVPTTIAPGLCTLMAAGVLLALLVPRAWTAPVQAAAIVSAACLAIALGAVPASWLERIPLVANLNSVDYIFTAAALVPLALVGAVGLARLDQRLSTPGGAVLVAVVLGGLAAALFFYIGGAEALGRLQVYPALLATGAAAALPWVAWSLVRPSATRLGLPATALLIAVILLPGGLHLDSGVPVIDRVLMQPRHRADVQAISPAVAVARGLGSEPFRALGVNMVLFPGTQALYGLEGLIGADALELPYLRELGESMGMFDHPWGWLTLVGPQDLERLAGLLDMLGVRVLLTAPEGTAHGRPAGPGRVSRSAQRGGAPGRVAAGVLRGRRRDLRDGRDARGAVVFAARAVRGGPGRRHRQRRAGGAVRAPGDGGAGRPAVRPHAQYHHLHRDRAVGRHRRPGRGLRGPRPARDAQRRAGGVPSREPPLSGCRHPVGGRLGGADRISAGAVERVVDPCRLRHPAGAGRRGSRHGPAGGCQGR